MRNVIPESPGLPFHWEIPDPKNQNKSCNVGLYRPAFSHANSAYRIRNGAIEIGRVLFDGSDYMKKLFTFIGENPKMEE